MINEHDINDWILHKPTELYTVKPKTYIEWLDQVFFFDHLDGMYSYCITADNQVVHIRGNAVVTPLEKRT
jgi:hypothetical protein